MITTKEEFIARAVERFEKGFPIYSDATFRRTPNEIIEELQDELVDAAVYVFILTWRYRLIGAEANTLRLAASSHIASLMATAALFGAAWPAETTALESEFAGRIEKALGALSKYTPTHDLSQALETIVEQLL